MIEWQNRFEQFVFARPSFDELFPRRHFVQITRRSQCPSDRSNVIRREKRSNRPFVSLSKWRRTNESRSETRWIECDRRQSSTVFSFFSLIFSFDLVTRSSGASSQFDQCRSTVVPERWNGYFDHRRFDPMGGNLLPQTVPSTSEISRRFDGFSFRLDSPPIPFVRRWPSGGEEQRGESIFRRQFERTL